MPAGLDFENGTIDEQAMPQAVSVVLPENIEINNTDISINSDINNETIPKVKQDVFVF